MSTVLDYLKWRGDLTFEQDPFNEVDNIILAQLVYLDLDGIVYGLTSTNKIRLVEVCKLYRQKLTNENSKASYILENTYKLLELVATSKRFEDCWFSQYVNDINTVTESQFSALKIDIPNVCTYVVFSGTDTTYVGWKENFNMLFLEEVPSQKKAINYLQHVLMEHEDIVYVGGHSKGGHLAIHATCYLPLSLQNKINKIFNNDGMGVLANAIDSLAYQRIKDRIITIIPQFSWVGVLFEHQEYVKVIESTLNGVYEHDMLGWKVDQNHLVENQSLDYKSIIIRKGNDFLRFNLTYNQKKELVDKLFELIYNTSIDEIGKFKKVNILDLIKLIQGLTELTEENKKLLMRYFKVLFSNWLKYTQKKSLNQKD